METALASTRAERSLYSDRPWAGGRFKKFSGPPDGWVFSETLGRWADPPACWKFSGRYWIRNPNCRNWISSTCKRGSGCQYYHPPRSECSSTSQTRVATPNCDFDSKSRTNTSHAGLCLQNMQSLVLMSGRRFSTSRMRAACAAPLAFC